MSQPQPVAGQGATEAPTTDMDAKTDDLFNGFGARGTPIVECVNEPVAPTARGNGRFEDNKFIFSERETIEDGLGPTYNDVGCVECHQSVDVGAFSQAMEFRAGHLVNGSFSLPAALQAKASSPLGTGGALAAVGGSASPTPLLSYAAPVSNDNVSLSFSQDIGANDALRTGTYSKTLTFTLSTTTP